MFKFQAEEGTERLFVRFSRGRRAYMDEMTPETISALMRDAFDQGVSANQGQMWDVLGLQLNDEGHVIQSY